jgi:hypothetical protein
MAQVISLYVTLKYTIGRRSIALYTVLGEPGMDSTVRTKSSTKVRLIGVRGCE